MSDNKANYLDLIPRHSEKLSFEKNPRGEVTITIENKGLFNRLLQRIAKKPMFTKIDLAGQGSFVWLCIDGNRTVYDIAIIVKSRFGDEAEPLYDRLIAYMHTLERCGFIVMRKPIPQDSAHLARSE